MEEILMNKDNNTNPVGTSSQAEQYIPDPSDVEKNKVMAGLSYLIFFLPLIACPDSKYGKFHANQALLLFIVSLAGNIILKIIPIIGRIITPIFGVAVLILGIMGLINGLNGNAKELPIFGKYRIIK
jgi:uncharacterized membrane protein